MFNFIDLSKLLDIAIAAFLSDLIDDLISYFSNILVDIMGLSQNIFNMPIVQNGIKYSQTLAFTILVIKVINEAYQTYILYQNGDPDADPTGLLVRTAQAVAVITVLPWIVSQLFMFGTKVATDVANLSSGRMSYLDWQYIKIWLNPIMGLSFGPIFCIIIVIMLLIVAFQATIRGAELALMSVLGPIMALNITANNRGIWSSWFRQVVIICTSQAIQIFMLAGAMSLISSQSISNKGLLFFYGWLWVAIKSPKYVQQFAYSTGFTKTLGGAAKNVGSTAAMLIRR